MTLINQYDATQRRGFQLQTRELHYKNKFLEVIITNMSSQNFSNPHQNCSKLNFLIQLFRQLLPPTNITLLSELIMLVCGEANEFLPTSNLLDSLYTNFVLSHASHFYGTDFNAMFIKVFIFGRESGLQFRNDFLIN